MPGACRRRGSQTIQASLARCCAGATLAALAQDAAASTLLRVDPGLNRTEAGTVLAAAANASDQALAPDCAVCANDTAGDGNISAFTAATIRASSSATAFGVILFLPLSRDIQNACTAGARQVQACEIAGIDTRTLQRWNAHQRFVLGDRQPEAVHPKPNHGLSADGRAAVLSVANGPRFAYAPPAAHRAHAR